MSDSPEGKGLPGQTGPGPTPVKAVFPSPSQESSGLYHVDPGPPGGELTSAPISWSLGPGHHDPRPEAGPYPTPAAANSRARGARQALHTGGVFLRLLQVMGEGETGWGATGLCYYPVCVVGSLCGAPHL